MGSLAAFGGFPVHIGAPVTTWAYWSGTTTSFLDGFRCNTLEYCSNPPPKCPAFGVWINQRGLTQAQRDGTCRTHSPWKEVQFSVDFPGFSLCTGALGQLAPWLSQAIPTYGTVTTPQPCDK